MGKRIIDSEADQMKSYPIQPINISTYDHFWEAFGNNETEISARLIVRLCQKKGGWFPFTKEEIDKSTKNFRFHQLCDSFNPKDGQNLVILGDDGRYRVTHEFIASCFRSSPNI